MQILLNCRIQKYAVQPGTEGEGFPGHICPLCVVRLAVQGVTADQKASVSFISQHDLFNVFLPIGRVVVLLIAAKGNNVSDRLEC